MYCFNKRGLHIKIHLLIIFTYILSCKKIIQIKSKSNSQIQHPNPISKSNSKIKFPNPVPKSNSQIQFPNLTNPVPKSDFLWATRLHKYDKNDYYFADFN